MVILMFGYFVMGLIFLILRFFYHILPKKSLHKNLLHAVKGDLVILYNYVKQIILSNPKKIEFIVVMMVCLVILPMTPLRLEIEFIVEDFFSAIMFFALVIIFAPKEHPADRGFPVEIFGFIYSIIFMY